MKNANGSKKKGGYKVTLNVQEAHELWIRDRADLMQKPHLIRIQFPGDFTKDNCKWVEEKDIHRHG